eukprot:1954489-Prymnesium_polylepis.2
MIAVHPAADVSNILQSSVWLLLAKSDRCVVATAPRSAYEAPAPPAYPPSWPAPAPAAPRP